MNNKGFIARIPKDISNIVVNIQTNKEWTMAHTLRKLITSSPLYLEFSQVSKEK